MARLQYPLDSTHIPYWTRISYKKRITTDFGEQSREVRHTATTLGEIYLYMPIGVTFSDGLAFDQVNLNNIVSTVAGAAEGQQAESLVGGLIEGKVSDMASQGGTLGGFAATTILGQGKIRNPRTEMLFKTPTLRSFSMNFKMMPNNAKESEQISEIIKTIRSNAYPERVDGFFQFPNIFSIDFVAFNGDANPKLIKLADAYCTAVSTNFNPTSPAFFDDGAPAETDLSITFQETEALDRAKIEAGY